MIGGLLILCYHIGCCDGLCSLPDAEPCLHALLHFVEGCGSLCGSGGELEGHTAEASTWCAIEVVSAACKGTKMALVTLLVPLSMDYLL